LVNAKYWGSHILPCAYPAQKGIGAGFYCLTGLAIARQQRYAILVNPFIYLQNIFKCINLFMLFDCNFVDLFSRRLFCFKPDNARSGNVVGVAVSVGVGVGGKDNFARSPCEDRPPDYERAQRHRRQWSNVWSPCEEDERREEICEILST
jgi:hypothetical protein